MHLLWEDTSPKVAQAGERFLGDQTTTSRRDASAAFPLLRAGFWTRLIAGIIDLILLIVPFAVFVSFFAAATGISNPFFNHRPGTRLNETLTQSGPMFLLVCIGFFAAESWLYFALSESSAWHATLGKRLLGLYVGDAAGKPVDFWRASARFCSGRLLAHVPVLGGYYFVIDCLCVGLTPSRRAIHDMLSGCLVLREGTRRSFVR
jgi:uncharacterized RDD family membrane protein YckC